MFAKILRTNQELLNDESHSAYEQGAALLASEAPHLHGLFVPNPLICPYVHTSFGKD